MSITDQIIAACEQMGLVTEYDHSSLSPSEYLTIRSSLPADDDEDAFEPITVRVSNHLAGRNCSPCDYYLGKSNGSNYWYASPQRVGSLIDTIADHFGVEVPAKWGEEAMSARSTAAKKAAQARRRAKAERFPVVLAALMAAHPPGSGVLPTKVQIAVRHGVTNAEAGRLRAELARLRRLAKV